MPFIGLWLCWHLWAFHMHTWPLWSFVVNKCQALGLKGRQGFQRSQAKQAVIGQADVSHEAAMWKTTSLVAQGENKLATLLTMRPDGKMPQISKAHGGRAHMWPFHVTWFLWDSGRLSASQLELSLKQETDRKQFSEEGSFLSWQHVLMKEFIPSSSPGKVDSSFISKAGKGGKKNVFRLLKYRMKDRIKELLSKAFANFGECSLMDSSLMANHMQFGIPGQKDIRYKWSMLFTDMVWILKVFFPLKMNKPK